MPASAGVVALVDFGVNLLILLTIMAWMELCRTGK